MRVACFILCDLGNDMTNQEPMKNARFSIRFYFGDTHAEQ